MLAMRKKISLTFLIILTLLMMDLPAQAYFFATDLETQVLALDKKNIELIVTKKDDKDESEAFPVGTIFKGEFYEYSFNKHFVRDEYLKVHLYEAKLPDGTIETIDNNIKVKPRIFIDNSHGIQLLGFATGMALKFTIAFWTVGFPAYRGIKGITEAAYAVHNTPIKESKWKEGSKGFVKGVLFPLPELVLKGEELPIHDESYIWIQDAKKEKQNISAFVVKRKNIYLDKEKYYEEIGKEQPDFTDLLRPKDYAKYQEKLAKKGVKAEIKESLVEEIPQTQPDPVVQEESQVEEQELLEEEKVELPKNNQYNEQELTLNRHQHNFERSWRRPKVQFQDVNR